jgi:TRAP transporter TAXI family solute receptor
MEGTVIMKKSKLLLSLFLCLALMFVVVACGGSGDTGEVSDGGSQETNEGAQETEDWGRFSVGAASIGSASYTKTVAWANYLMDKIAFSPIIEATSGSTANVQLIENNETQIGQTMTNIGYEAWQGVGWADGQKYRNIRLMCVLDPFALQFYTHQDSGIKSIYDLEGKTISLSKANTGTDIWARRLFEVLDIKPSKIVNVNPSEQNDLLRDKMIDAAGCMGSVHPSILELAATMDVEVFGVSGEDAAAFTEKYPELYSLTIPAGSYEGIDHAIETIGEYDNLIVHKDLPDELVYEMVKHTYEGIESMSAAYEGFRSISPEGVTLAKVPLHKGAYKYYQELGIEIPDEIKPID